MIKIINIWVLGMRLKTLPLAILSVLLSGSLSYRYCNFNVKYTVICALFSIFVQIGTNYSNDYFDYMNGKDTESRSGPRRITGSGVIPPNKIFLSSIVFMILASLTGISIINYDCWWLAIVGFVSILCGMLYTGGPFPLGYYGLGDLMVFVFFGLVSTITTFYLQNNFFVWELLLVAIAAGLLINNVLIVANCRDMNEDRSTKKRTIPVLFGLRASCRQYLMNTCFVMIIPTVLLSGNCSFNAILPLILTPSMFLTAIEMFKETKPRYFFKLLSKTILHAVLYSALLSTGLIKI